MRVLYYHQHFSTPRGRTGVRSYEFARRLVARGHQVTMVCGSYSGSDSGLTGAFVKGRREGVVDGIRVIEFSLPYSNTDGLSRRAVTFLRFSLRSIGVALREDYDVLFATSTPLTAGIPGIVARPLRRRPFVFEVRDLWPELPRDMGVITNPVLLGALSLLEWLSYRAADRCIGLSPGIKQGIMRHGVADDAVAMIPNGCDLDLFGAGEGRRPPGTEGSALVAVFTGTHGRANGLGAVLDAAAALKRRGRRDIRLVLIGEGREKAALVERARREDLDDVVLFLDPVAKADLAAYLRGVDVGMQILANVPSFYYGTSPNKFFDYIAAGLPVLNNYPGWLADMITETGCGIAVPPEDPEAFADALERFAAMAPEERQAMGRAARALAEARFARQDLADQFVDVLEQAVAPASGPRAIGGPAHPTAGQ